MPGVHLTTLPSFIIFKPVTNKDIALIYACTYWHSDESCKNLQKACLLHRSKYTKSYPYTAACSHAQGEALTAECSPLTLWLLSGFWLLSKPCRRHIVKALTSLRCKDSFWWVLPTSGIECFKLSMDLCPVCLTGESWLQFHDLWLSWS